jgi:hypothetical protein
MPDMHNDDDEFLRSIPPFLRRYQEPSPRKLPIRPRDLPATRSKAEPQSQSQAQSQSRPAPAATPSATPAPAAPVESPVAQRARIALAFENQDMAECSDGDDVAFQVTLPRGVVRQIRMLAAEQDTTQRAVVLRALRLAGLSVPEGSDIDRRSRGAKRQA